MTEKPDILERLHIPCTDRSCEDCDADRVDAANEIMRLRVYEAAVKSVGRQHFSAKAIVDELEPHEASVVSGWLMDRDDN